MVTMLLWPDKLFTILITNISILLLFFLVVGCGDFVEDSAVSKFVNHPSSPDLHLTGESKKDNVSIDKKKVDIVFVVDTSYSMIYHLEQVHQSFAGFLNELSPMSWRIAFTNADYDPRGFDYYRRDLFKGRWINLEQNGQVLKDRVLHPGLRQSKEIFIDTLKRYKTGDVPELADQHLNPCDLPPYCQSQVRHPLYSLMTSVAINQHQFRKDADFIGIIFSNGDETFPVSADFMQRLKNMLYKKSDRQKSIRIFSISIVPDDQDCLQKNQSLPNNFGEPRYADSIFGIVKATKGYMISICSPDFSPLAKVIADVL